MLIVLPSRVDVLKCLAKSHVSFTRETYTFLIDFTYFSKIAYFFFFPPPPLFFNFEIDFPLFNILCSNFSLKYDILHKYFIGFPYVKKFYLIYDVFYARQINVYVRINDEVDEFCIRERTPIGFRMKRFKIQANGLIGPVKDITSKSWIVHWIKNSMFRNPMDALPNLPNTSKFINSATVLRNVHIW